MTQTIYRSSILLLSSSCQSSAKWLDLHLLPGKKIMRVAVGGLADSCGETPSDKWLWFV